MHLVVIAHKKIWLAPDSPSDFVTTGGFPLQMAALATLFDRTTLYSPVQSSSRPDGAVALTGPRLRVVGLAGLPERGLGRKVAMIRWLPRHWRALRRAIATADVVHTPVPGDVGTIGLLLTALARRRLFVRHCSAWGKRDTLTERGLNWLLPRLAGPQTVVMATGGAENPPSPRSPVIRWIFATTLTAAQWERLTPAPAWQPGTPLRLLTAGRLEPIKNLTVVLDAMATLRQSGRDVSLIVIGDGSCRPALLAQTAALDLTDCVRFTGQLSRLDVLNEMSRSHLFLLPSQVEGFPKAVVEAMACGLPVVATAVSALPSLIGTDAGRLLDRPDAPALATAVSELMEDPGRLAQLALGARARSQAFTLESWRETIGASLTATWGQLRS